MSILSSGGRTYGFDLDLIKPPSPSSGRSSSSSPSSTISESSNSPLAISTKRARTPRKRPNQSYSEAAALLSTIYPNLFSTKNLHKLSKHYKPFSSLSPSLLSSSDLLPSFPVLNEAGFLIQDHSPHEQPSLRFEFKPASPSEKSCIKYQEPSSQESSDYDVDSILDEEVGEGIDSIMGNMSMENCQSNSNSCINPYLGSLMGFGIGGKADLGFGFGLGLARNNVRQALRGAHNEEWWRPTTVMLVQDIVPKFNALPPLEKKKTKKKKKVEKEGVKEEVKNESKATPTPTTTIPATTSTTTIASSSDVELKPALGLKLNHEDVLKAWSDREFPFFNESGTSESTVNILARLADIDLFPESEGGVREAIVQRYREKRRTRLFSKKIRYQVRKVNADHRPRMKASYHCHNRNNTYKYIALTHIHKVL